MKITTKLMFLLSLFFFTQSASAGDWTVGLFLGQTSFDELSDSCDAAASGANVDLAIEGIPARFECSVDDSDTAIGINVGYSFNKYFGIELGYVDLGEYEAEISLISNFFTLVNDIGPIKATAEATYFSGVATWPFSDKFSVSGRLGGVDVSGEVSASTFSEDVSSDVEVTLGASLDYQITNLLSLTLRYDRFDDFDTYGVGLNYHF